MKMIAKGDRVRAYLNPEIHGTVVEVVEEPARVWTLEGTLSMVRICTVQLKDGRFARVRSSDLFIEY
jgi:hypothetical protein